MVPLQTGLPVFPELLSISLSVLPYLLILYAFYLLGTKASAERVDELERQVGRLARRIEELEEADE